MGLWSRIFGGKVRDTQGSDAWLEPSWSSPSVTGMQINQMTSLQSATVMACVRMLALDVAKAIPEIFKKVKGQSKTVAESHILHTLFNEPNDWQTWPEFCAQMQLGLILRGNGYAVMVRDFRGFPMYFVPINPDRVALWESPDGSLFYMVTRSGLHELSVLRSVPLMVPSRDMLHLKGLSSNGLLGFSPIAIAREAIGLSLAQEQQAARWMGNAARPSGILTTDQKLTPEAAKRMGADWQDAKGGLQNSGKTAVLEQGLKFQTLSMTSSDLEFIASRRYQGEEIARVFRIPVAMVCEVGSSSRVDPDVLAQHYVNYTISDYTTIWASVLSKKFGLWREDLVVEFDMRVLLQADMGRRIDMHRNAVMGGLETQNEGRAGIGIDPMAEGADVLLTPSNSTPFGSDKSGTAPTGAGRPSKSGNANPDQPNAT